MFETIITSLLGNLGSTLIDKVFPNKADADKAKLALLQLQQDGELKAMAIAADLNKTQASITAIEAQSDSFFKSGARPALLWGTGLIFLIPGLMPWISWVLNMCGVHVPTLPSIDQAIYDTALFSLLGLSGLRSYDKYSALKQK